MVPASALQPSAIATLIDELVSLRGEMLRAEHDRADVIAKVHPRHRRSAANLLHYVTLRRHDVRELQDALTPLGLSSLGRAEAHVLATVDAVLTALAGLAGVALDLQPCDAVGFAEGAELLHANAEGLLGPPAPGRATRIMVTLPTRGGRRHRPGGADGRRRHGHRPYQLRAR